MPRTEPIGAAWSTGPAPLFRALPKIARSGRNELDVRFLTVRWDCAASPVGEAPAISWAITGSGAGTPLPKPHAAESSGVMAAGYWPAVEWTEITMSVSECSPANLTAGPAALSLLPVQLLREQIRFGMRRYRRSPSPRTAHLVAEALETLICHPDFHAGIGERCHCKRVVSYWRMLAR